MSCVLCVSFKSAAKIPFKYVTISILTTYLPVVQQKKDIALKCGRHVCLYQFHNIHSSFLDGFKVGWHLCLKKMEFYFLSFTIKKLENLRWRFGKFSTLYFSAFFALYFKSYVLEA